MLSTLGAFPDSWEGPLIVRCKAATNGGGGDCCAEHVCPRPGCTREKHKTDPDCGNHKVLCHGCPPRAVRLHGLKSQHHLNGTFALVVEHGSGANAAKLGVDPSSPMDPDLAYPKRKLLLHLNRKNTQDIQVSKPGALNYPWGSASAHARVSTPNR